MVALSKKTDCIGQVGKMTKSNPYCGHDTESVQRRGMTLLTPKTTSDSNSCDDYCGGKDCSWNCWQIE